MILNRAVAATCAALSLFSIATFAELANAQETMLEVERADGTVEAYDIGRLDGLDQVSFETGSRWIEGTEEYSGPALLEVLDDVGVDADTVSMVAQDGYSVLVDLGSEVVTDSYPILATRRDGETFPPDRLGPIWVMYPYDDRPELDVKEARDYSIWQLTRIEVPN